MSTFDAEVFAKAVLADVCLVISEAEKTCASFTSFEVKHEVKELQDDIEATLAAIEIERDGRRARALRDDLEKFLPARKASILSCAQRSGCDLTSSLEAPLALATRAALIVARAFVTSGGL